MVQKKDVTVTFDHRTEDNTPVYYSGDIISGKVKLEIKEAIRVKSLTISTKGKAKVRWVEVYKAGPAVVVWVYSSHEKYFTYVNVILGTKDTKKKKKKEEKEHFAIQSQPVTLPTTDILAAGQHEFPFSFQLPNIQLPHSFKGKHGNVSYYVKVELHRPLHPLSTVLKAEYILDELINVNTPLLQSSQMEEKEKTLCCGCSSSGSISMTAKLNKKGCLPGETVEVIAEIQNWSSRKIKLKAYICQRHIFIARKKKVKEKHLVKLKKEEKILPGQKEMWSFTMEIPEAAPSLLNCAIISLEYSVQVIACIPRSRNLILDMPIIIGVTSETPPSHQD